MGLYTVTGTMGGGKSYFAAELAYKCWLQGGIVHSLNLNWNVEKLKELGYWDEKHITLPKDLTRWVRKEPGPDGEERLASDVIVGGTEGAENLIIIDEAGLSLNSMDQAENKKRNRILFELITMSRQIGVDVYIIIQAATSLDVFIRNISEAHIHLKDMERIPGMGFFFGLVLGKFQRSYLSPQTKKAISRSYARFNPFIGSLYHTHGVGDKINLKRSEGRKGKAKGNLSIGFLLFIGGIVSALCYSGYRVYKFMTPPPGQYSEIDPRFHLKGHPTAGAPAVGKSTQDKAKEVIEPFVVARALDNTFVAASDGSFYATHGHGTKMRGVIDQGDTLAIHLLNGTIVTLKTHE